MLICTDPSLYDYGNSYLIMWCVTALTTIYASGRFNHLWFSLVVVHGITILLGAGSYVRTLLWVEVSLVGGRLMLEHL
jgi:hypothetical protein